MWKELFGNFLKFPLRTGFASKNVSILGFMSTRWRCFLGVGLFYRKYEKAGVETSFLSA